MRVYIRQDKNQKGGTHANFKTMISFKHNLLILRVCFRQRRNLYKNGSILRYYNILASVREIEIIGRILLFGVVVQKLEITRVLCFVTAIQ